MRRYTIGLIGILGMAASVSAQQPMPLPMPAQVQPAEITFLPISTQEKKDDKKDDKKKDDTKQPETPQPPPPVTFPATNRADLPASAVAAAGTSVRRSSQPNVYGNSLTGNTYSPYLIATLPNGSMQTVLPGQQAVFPLGTTFSRPVPTTIVTTFQLVPLPGVPTQISHQLVQVNQLGVVGPDAYAHDGGLPINVVRGSFKIGENESPRPQDRIYATYNFFSDVNPSLSVPGLPVTNVHRTTLGLEKTFFDGNASVGLRLPLLQINGAANIERQSVGDLSAVLKYAIVNDWHDRGDGSLIGGNALCVGMVVTAPTGNAATFSALSPKIHSTYLQPYVGAIWAQNDWYVQGFSSIAVPTDERDTTFLFNSVQVGYTIYEAPLDGRLVRSITPILECQVNTPLNNRGIYRLPIGSFDEVSITTGMTFGLGKSAFLNLGVNVPLTGPKPYAIEALAQLNWRY